jgi:hypothetical protein
MVVCIGDDARLLYSDGHLEELPMEVLTQA